MTQQEDRAPSLHPCLREPLFLAGLLRMQSPVLVYFGWTLDSIHRESIHLGSMSLGLARIIDRSSCAEDKTYMVEWKKIKTGETGQAPRKILLQVACWRGLKNQLNVVVSYSLNLIARTSYTPSIPQDDTLANKLCAPVLLLNRSTPKASASTRTGE